MQYGQYIGLFVLGGLGVLVRYWATQIIPKSSILPIATIVVNLFGAFLLGVLCQQFSKTSSMWILFAIGFCGGLTTFSGIAIELHYYVSQQKIVLALLYGVTSLVLGVLVLWAGQQLATRWSQIS